MEAVEGDPKRFKALYWRVNRQSEIQEQDFYNELEAWRRFGSVASEVDVQDGGFAGLWNGHPFYVGDEDEWISISEAPALAKVGVEICWCGRKFAPVDRGMRILSKPHAWFCDDHWPYVVDRLTQADQIIAFPTPSWLCWRADADSPGQRETLLDETSAWRRIVDILPAIRAEAGGYCSLHPPSEQAVVGLEPDFWTPSPVWRIGSDLCFRCLQPCDGEHVFFKGGHARPMCDPGSSPQIRLKPYTEY